MNLFLFTVFLIYGVWGKVLKTEKRKLNYHAFTILVDYFFNCCFLKYLFITRSLVPWKLPHYIGFLIRVNKQSNIKSWDQQNYLVIRGFCYIDLVITRFQGTYTTGWTCWGSLGVLPTRYKEIHTLRCCEEESSPWLLI